MIDSKLSEIVQSDKISGQDVAMHTQVNFIFIRDMNSISSFKILFDNKMLNVLFLQKRT